MTDVLGRIDNVLAGDLCPCGATPAPGSAYCGDDCTPTHIADDTDRSAPGEHGAQSTPMRWRPDLVTAHDDSDLLDLGTTTFYDGRYNARLYQRGIPPQGHPVTWHLRLDDGHRYVGCDLDGVNDIATEDHAARVTDAWRRLERELGDSRHLELDNDPWADVFGRILSPATPPSSGPAWRRRCVHCGQRALPRDTIVPAATPLIAWTVDAGIPGQPGDVIANVERGHDCGYCGQRFPGPALLVMRFDRPEADFIEFRMVIGDRKAGLRVFERDLARHQHPEEWLERRLERMEAELLTAYARAYPNRPDVVEWAEACNQHARREAQRHMGLLGPAISPQVARSLFQNLT